MHLVHVHKFGECLIKCSFGCCCYKQKPGGYSGCQKCLPFLFYILFSFAAMAFAVVALVQISAFSDGITNLVCATDRIRIETGAFMSNLATPVKALSGNATTVIDNVDTTLKGTDGIKTDLQGIIADLAKFETDAFGARLLGAGLTAEMIKEWCVDAQVVLPGQDGKKGSIFDALEDMDVDACLAKCVEISKAQ